MSNRYETEREIQKIYIAYYGRPADPEGQQFWADQLEASGGDLSAIIDVFGDSDEFQDVYGELSIVELVNNLFQQLFGRDAAFHFRRDAALGGDMVHHHGRHQRTAGHADNHLALRQRGITVTPAGDIVVGGNTVRS